MEQAQPTGQGEHVVAEGDSLISIATAAGHLPDTLWNDAGNADLKTARGDGEVLLPGDRVTVIERREHTEARATGARHVFKRVAVPCKVTILCEDEEGSPFAGKKYELRIDGQTHEGTTDDTGKIECDVAPNAVRGELKVWLNEPGLPEIWTRELRLGALHPKNDVIGVQQRLANLGYYAGPLDGKIDERLLSALGTFLTGQGLTPSGELDDDAVAKLVEVHRI